MSLSMFCPRDRKLDLVHGARAAPTTMGLMIGR
jgi:hypothetical protein